MKKLGSILVLCLVPLFGAFSQEAVFAPFVSNLEAELKNGFIRLTWEDSRNSTGPVFIYRSDTPFPVSPLPQGVEVPYGAQSYVDEADRPGTFYYFVVSSDEWNRKYLIPIPYTNTIGVMVSGSDTAFFLNGSREVPGTPAEKAIHSLKAEEDNGKIVLSFEGGGKSAVLYRATKPLLNSEDLLYAVIVGRGASSPFIDYPVPGIPYYYALVFEEEMNSGMVLLSAGRNTTADPVAVRREQETPAPDGRIRTMPLPPIRAESARSGLSPDIPSAPLNEEALAAAGALTGPSSKTVPFREPAVFLEDIDRSAATFGGENSRLSQIVQGTFSGRNWEEAGEELRRFLSLPRPAAVESRSRFYLGQVYYFTGKPREALFEFLAARNIYPSETTPWIDAVLARLVN
jgi:hypothetical protein